MTGLAGRTTCPSLVSPHEELVSVRPEQRVEHLVTPVSDRRVNGTDT